ncbi:unnamed protein product [Vicia faba]|uniref:Replication protein A 70 kDa DNA-binding subunit B/D first OB fold domain-containing protein n=1 Tax=Vicia faba TaxID=3906 RepID=A0AAV1AWG9_VICFA|nr:unnamed protein product [Vicia faba]
MVRPFEMIGDINNRKELWKLSVKIHHKWKVSMTNKKHFDIVVVDKQGHDIHVVVSIIFRQTFDFVLSVNLMCMRSNFQVVPNDLTFIPTNHKYILKFTSGSTIGDIDKHDIRDKMTNLTPFADIILRKWHKHLLTDIIGVVDEIGYSQSQMGGKKPQINLVLRDLEYVS